MSLDWTSLVPSVIGGVLGGATVFVGGHVERRATARSARQANKADAYTGLLTAAGMLALKADALRLTVEFRSGVAEKLAVLGGRQPVDPMTLHDWMRTDVQQLYDASSRVWTYGSQSAIRQANGLLTAAGDLLALSTQWDETRSRAKRRVAGERLSPDQLRSIQDAQKSLANARRSFAELARAETGAERADLFLHP